MFYGFIREKAKVTDIFAMLSKLTRDESGATTMEYGFTAILVSIAAITLFQVLGDTVELVYIVLGSDLANVATASGP